LKLPITFYITFKDGGMTDKLSLLHLNCRIDGSCVFDLQSGGQFLTHNFVVKAQITSLQQKWENNESKGNTFHLYFQ